MKLKSQSRGGESSGQYGSEAKFCEAPYLSYFSQTPTNQTWCNASGLHYNMIPLNSRKPYITLQAFLNIVPLGRIVYHADRKFLTLPAKF